MYKILVFMLFIAAFSDAQTRDEKIIKGIDHVYKLEFDSANSIFQVFIDSDPKDPTGYFFPGLLQYVHRCFIHIRNLSMRAQRY